MDRPHRSAVSPVEHEDPTLLGDLRDGRDLPPADRDVDKVGRRREIEVPDVVVDDLVVPDAATGPRVETDDAVREQVVALAVAAVEVVRRSADRQVDVAEFQVGGHRRPDVGAADPFGGAVLPGRVAELAAAGHGMEGPQQLAGTGVVTADVAGRPLRLRRPVHDRRADDDHVADHGRRRGVSVLVGAVVERTDAGRKVDGAAVAEVLPGGAGRGIERDQAGVTGGQIDRLRFAVRPPGESAVEKAVVRRAPRVVASWVVDPEFLAGRGVDGGRLAEGGAGVEDAVLHQWCRFKSDVVETGVGVRDRVVRRFPAPADTQVADVSAVDLAERGVLRAAGIAAVLPPFAADGAVLGRRRRAGRCRSGQEEDG